MDQSMDQPLTFNDEGKNKKVGEDLVEALNFGQFLTGQIIYGIIKTFMYTFMLIVMTYNFWLILAVVTG